MHLQNIITMNCMMHSLTSLNLWGIMILNKILMLLSNYKDRLNQYLNKLVS